MPTRSLTYSTGATLKTVLRDYSTGAERLWNTATPALEAYSSGNAASYGLATAEGSPGTYTWAVPVSLPASAAGHEYEATTYLTAGANLAVPDLANPVWRSTFAWDGTKPVVQSGDAYAAASKLPAPTGTTWYVTATGSDSNAGTSPSAAFASLDHAVSTAASGDTILLGDGTFTPSGPIKWPGKSLTIRGAGMDRTTFAGSAVNYLCPGGTSVIEGLTTSGQVAYKTANGDTPWSRLVINRCRLTSQFDAHYPSGDGAGAVTDIYDSELQSAECCITVGASNVLTRLWRCTLAGTQTALHAGAPIEAYDCILKGQAAADATYVPVATATGGIIRLVRGGIVASGTTAPPTYQIENNAGTIEIYGFAYDPTKVVGTLTYVNQLVTSANPTVIRDLQPVSRVITATGT